MKPGKSWRLGLAFAVGLLALAGCGQGARTVYQAPAQEHVAATGETSHGEILLSGLPRCAADENDGDPGS